MGRLGDAAAIGGPERGLWTLLRIVGQRGTPTMIADLEASPAFTLVANKAYRSYALAVMAGRARSALSQTTEQGLTHTNVALRAQRPRPHARPRRGPETWTAHELTSFLSVAGGHRLYPALHLTATTGMRRGEIAGLRWGDWNAGMHQLSISRTRQALAGRSTEVATRTRTSRRCLELDANTEHVLNRWRWCFFELITSGGEHPLTQPPLASGVESAQRVAPLRPS